MSCEPWQCAEIAATKKANPIQKPEIAVAMMKKAQRPLLIVGSNVTERWMEGRQSNRLLHHRPCKCIQIPVVANSSYSWWLCKERLPPAAFMTAMDIAIELLTQLGRGLDAKGHPDLVRCMLVYPNYMESLILSGLKHFAPDFKNQYLGQHVPCSCKLEFPKCKHGRVGKQPQSNDFQVFKSP